MESSSPSNSGRIQKIAVVGGGSAGFLAALTLKTRLPQLDVTVVHSSSIPIIGVGEGTTFTMPIFLHGYLGIDPTEFHREVRPTYKLGIRFLWGPRPRFHYSFTNQLDARRTDLPRANGFYCYEDYDYADINGALMGHERGFLRQQNGAPVVDTTAAYHLENGPFVAFLEKRAREIGIEIIDAEVTNVVRDDDKILDLQLDSERSCNADFFIDCSGFRSLLLGEAMDEKFEDFSSSLFCDRAVAGGWQRSGETLLPFTTAETMDNGWCWQIEHDQVVNRGYVYSSNAVSDDKAEEEFRRKNPKVTDTRVIGFTTGARRNTWAGNVVALGNAAGFVEPLEATNLAVICDHAAKLVDTLKDSAMTVVPTSRMYYNRYTQRMWQGIRRFLAMHYRFNTRLDTAFWRACQEDTDLAGAEEIIEYYQACGPGLLWAREAMGADDPFNWEGYLAMLVGQKVAHNGTHQPESQELAIWQDYMRRLNQTAGQGIGMADALAMIRSSNWQWHPDFYQRANRW